MQKSGLLRLIAGPLGLFFVAGATLTCFTDWTPAELRFEAFIAWLALVTTSFSLIIYHPFVLRRSRQLREHGVGLLPAVFGSICVTAIRGHFPGELVGGMFWISLTLYFGFGLTRRDFVREFGSWGILLMITLATAMMMLIIIERGHQY